MQKKHAVILLFNAGLVERHSLMLRTLKEQGWQVTVVAWDRCGTAVSKNDLKDRADHWVWVHLPAPTWSSQLLAKLPRYYYQLWKVTSILDHSDLVIPTHIFLLPAACLFPGKRLYDAFEMYSLEMSMYFGSWAPRMLKLWQIIEGLLVSRMDGVMTLDSRQGWLAQHYRRWNPLVQVIWNVPSRAMDPDAGEINALAAEYDGRKIVTYIGGLMREKGLRVSLEVAAQVKDRHPDVLFEFIGPMKDDKLIIEKMVVDLGLINHVRFLGVLPYRQMLAHLHFAQVALALHQQERTYTYVSCGTGRKFFTYMQAGLPIIAPNFGEIGLIVKREECGLLIDTTKPEEINQAILYLLNNPEKAKQMGEKGRQAFLKTYNWEKEKQKYLNFLEKVLNTPKKSSRRTYL